MFQIPIREAVTAVVQAGDEVLMVRRSPALVSFPGYWAFPGGKVDAEDAQADPSTHGAWREGLHAAQAQALFRELHEEVGLDLDGLQRSGELLDVREFGTALTPPIAPVRFDTRFFHVRLRQRPTVVLDTGEVDQFRWARPMDLMEEYERGRLLMAPPTSAALREFAAGGPPANTVVELEAQTQGLLSMVQSVFGLRVIPVRSNTLPPAFHTNCFVIGDAGSPAILVDPSPWNDEELDQLHGRVSDMGIGAVFITHHHPDHHERADVLARRLQVPVWLSADTRARIAARQAGFFSGLHVRTIADGDEVARWLGQPVRALAVPGHDEGQLALMPDDRAWCIVGDLIQGIGTVVIHKPEGNMRRYFQSLERIIALDPKVIAPSHGMAMGTTHRLRETLRHRREREATVLDMHRAGQTVEEMLAAIYRGLDARLLPLARQNIEAHLDKLREDGAIA